MQSIEKEIARRRTFAIISHPDAGKTTLTEKFLLYGGAVQLAGSVTARKNQRATTSDWMELERQRGISVSSTVLQFEYGGYCVNLLDTPGHKDFSEDTYRVLTAVDAAVMVIDAAKGIEPQTRKLFEVCRQRGIPIFTFMNKLDRPAKDTLMLLDELERVLAGKLTPVFFGSAVNNFGVQLLLDSFLELAPSPRPRTVADRIVTPEDEAFSGFIFKIQANMDPKHRDRLAFVRVCSGRFERDMTVVHTRTGKKVRLSSSHKLFGRDRETMDLAFAGDVVGLVGHTDFRIGDTLSDDGSLVYQEIPRFTPECFAWLQSPSTAQFKRFREGLDQLLQEGVVQSLTIKDSAQRVPLLGAVGPLQFEVVQYRMQTEYGAESRLEQSPWKVMRWVTNGDATTFP